MESIRAWGLRFGRQFANMLKRGRPRPGDTWHLEVFLRIGGKQHDLWRAINQDGPVLDILVQGRRNTRAALRFVRKLLHGLQRVPRFLSTQARIHNHCQLGRIGGLAGVTGTATGQ